MITLNDIKNKASEIKRANELSKTPGGKEILKNIAKSNLLRLIDRTRMSSSKAALDSFSKLWLKDIVRPNRFTVEFGLKNKNQTLVNFSAAHLVKSFNIPEMKKNKIEAKRCGKTIKIPLNVDMSDPIELTFYQDSNNRVLHNLTTLFNLNEFQYDNQIIQKKDMYFYVKFIYAINMNYSPNNSGRGLVQGALDFFDIDLFNTYENFGKKKHIEKVLTENVNDKIIEFEFKNISVNSIGGLEFDMEKLETYNEVRVSIDYNGVKFKTWAVEDIKKFKADDKNVATKNLLYHEERNSSIDIEEMILL